MLLCVAVAVAIALELEIILAGLFKMPLVSADPQPVGVHLARVLPASALTYPGRGHVRLLSIKGRYYRVRVVGTYLMHARPPNLSDGSSSKVARCEESLDQANDFLGFHLELELAFVPKVFDIRQTTGQDFAKVL